jgi:hypothetical protein
MADNSAAAGQGEHPGRLHADPSISGRINRLEESVQK